MSGKKPITPAGNSANMQNANKGMPGVNRQYAQAKGNEGKMKNPTWKQGKK